MTTSTSNQQVSGQYQPFFNNSYTNKSVEEKDRIGSNEYLTREHQYTIATIPADWGILNSSSSLLGKLGHHACIKLPGQRICEWTPTPTAWSQVESGVEVRTATGTTIEKMWQSHLEMA